MARETLPVALDCQERGPPISLEIQSGGPHAAAELEHRRQFFNALIKQMFPGTGERKKPVTWRGDGLTLRRCKQRRCIL